MKDLFKFFSQILLLLVFISSIKTAEAAVNYKLTSVVREFGGNLSSWVGKRQAVIDFYVDFCNHSLGWLFHLDVNRTWYSYSIPMITWEVVGCNGYQSGVMKLVINNTFDEYINEFSDRLKSWLAGPDGIYGNNDDRRAYLRLGMKLYRIEY
jgi:hypothetical protein